MIIESRKDRPPTVALALLGLLLLLSSGINAGEGTGVGLVLGKPTGMNFKSWMAESFALNINFGWNFFNDRLYMNLDFLYHVEPIFNAPFYFGGGPRMEIDNASKAKNNYNVGPRAVAGWEIFFKDSPFSFFVEAAGILDILDFCPFRVSPDYNASIGLHYYLSR